MKSERHQIPTDSELRAVGDGDCVERLPQDMGVRRVRSRCGAAEGDRQDEHECSTHKWEPACEFIA